MWINLIVTFLNDENISCLANSPLYLLDKLPFNYKDPSYRHKYPLILSPYMQLLLCSRGLLAGWVTWKHLCFMKMPIKIICLKCRLSAWRCFWMPGDAPISWCSFVLFRHIKLFYDNLGPDLLLPQTAKEPLALTRKPRAKPNPILPPPCCNCTKNGRTISSGGWIRRFQRQKGFWFPLQFCKPSTL